MKHRLSLLSSLWLLLLVACQPPQGPTTPPSAAPASAPASAPAASSEASPRSNQAAIQGKALLAIYMVGSDLEDDIKPRNGISDEEDNGKISTRGSGTNDLRELLDGWKALSPAQQASLDVLVAFGGARKQGWQGVKYADLPCLSQDNEDGYFGNASCYRSSSKDANLSDQASLLTFLNTVKDQAKGHQRVVLDLWDHGAAFLGMGHDTNHPELPLVSLPALKQAFDSSGIHVDLLGFDACLMASLEVARALQPHADYLLASQELEPGHGWNYKDFVQLLATSTEIPALGKGLVDSFITNQDHQRSRNKTLSLTDLRKIPTLLTAVDSFVAKLPATTPVPVLPSLQATPEFGVQSRGGIAYTIDLREFVNNITHYQPELVAEGKTVLDLLGQAIVYRREDDSKPAAGGITIFSLNRELKHEYNEDQSVSRTFLSFVEQWVATQEKATEAPVLTSEGMAVSQLASAGGEVPVPECRSTDGQPGQCLRVQAPLGANLERLLALVNGQNIVVLARERLLPIDLKATRYFAPRWDGSWFRVCDGACGGGTSLTPPALLSHVTPKGNRVYVAEAELNGLPVDLFLELDPVRRVVSNSWMVPQVVSHGVIIPSRLDLALEAGDRLRFIGYQLQSDGGLKRVPGAELRFGTAPVWEYVPVPPEQGRPVYLARATAAASQQASYSGPIQAADANAGLQSISAAPLPQAVSLSLAPTRATLSAVGDSIRPVVYIKDAQDKLLTLPVVWKSLTVGLDVSPAGVVTLSNSDIGSGQVRVTEPVSGLSDVLEISLVRGGSSSASAGFGLAGLNPVTARNSLARVITLTGSNFLPGTTVMIGNTPASNVVVVGPTTLTATVPAGQPANVYDVTVKVPGLGSQTLPQALTVKGPFDVSWAASPLSGLTLPTGDINSIVFDPGNDNIRYLAGTVRGGINTIYRSVDAGNSWTQLVTGLPANANFNNLAIDPFNPTRLFVGENAHTVYRSTDSGATWAEQPTGMGNTSQQSQIVMDPVTPNTLYTTQAFYDVTGVLAKSTDGGSTWAPLNGDMAAPNTFNAYDLAVAPTNNQIMYLIRDNGTDVMKTVNGGVNWTAASTGLPNNGGALGPKQLLLNPQNPNRLYVLGSQGFFIHVPYRSTDGGTSWSQLSNGLPPNNPFVVDLSAMAMSPSQPNTLYAYYQGAGMYKSIDGGDNWQAINVGLPSTPFPDVKTITVDPLNPDLVYIGLLSPSTPPLYQTAP